MVFVATSSQALNIPPHIEPIAILNVGYPVTALASGKPKYRKRFEEVVFRDKFA